MSSPKHAAVANEISMQLKSSPHFHQRHPGGGHESETHTFIGGSPKRESPQHRKVHSEAGDDMKKGSCHTIAPTGLLQCICILICLILAIAVGFVVGFFIRPITESSSVTMTMATRKTMHQQAVSSISTSRISEYAKLHNDQQCTVGSTSCTGNLTQTIVGQLRSMGFKVSTSMYNVMLSYPDMTRPSQLRAMDTQGNMLQTGQVYGGDGSSPGYQLAPAGLTDGSAPIGLGPSGGNSVIVNDDASMPVYTPYTASGTAQGDLVYVNYGREADFVAIANLGVDVTGKIALARQGRVSAMDQAKVVASHGVLGLLLYPDPNDMTSDMPMTSAMNPDMSGMIGDPLTPGCPAVDGIYRSSMNTVDLPTIPIQPVSMATAAMLLSNLTGVPAEGEWIGGLNITYHIGATGDTRQTWFVELDVHNDRIMTPIYDVVATIEGSENPDQYVLLGGHYSSMMTSMVTSGSSSMVIEAATVLGDMLQDGWQPRRTIMVGLWEASEFGYTGSTEWAEENRQVLADRAVAYIDLNGGSSSGTILNTRTSPMLQGVIMDAADQLQISSMVNLGALDGAGDHVPFSHMIGIPSASIVIGNDDINNNVVPTASGVILGMASTQLATQVVLSLADDEIIGLDAGAMADTIMTYVDNLNSQMGGMMASSNMSIDRLRSAASDFATAVQGLEDIIQSDASMQSSVTMAMVNSRLMYMERSFIDSGSTGMMGSVLYGMQSTNTFSTISGMMSNVTGNVSMDMLQQTVSNLQCTIQSATQSVGMILS